MEDNGDTMSTIFSEALDASIPDRYSSHDLNKYSSSNHVSSPTKGFGPFYGQWLGSLVSPFAASEVISPNASQMSFSLVSPCPISPTNNQDSLNMSMSNNTLFPRGDHLSLLFSPNVFSPKPNNSDIWNNSYSATIPTMKPEKLSSLLSQNNQPRYSSTPKSLYEHVYSNQPHVASSSMSVPQQNNFSEVTNERTGRPRKKVIMDA